MTTSAVAATGLKALSVALVYGLPKHLCLILPQIVVPAVAPDAPTLTLVLILLSVTIVTIATVIVPVLRERSGCDRQAHN